MPVDIDRLAYEVRKTLNDASANSPRSKQRSIGPSEVGGDCERKIGYRLLGVDSVNEPDTWLAQIGTAVHAHLASIYEEANKAYDNKRYLIEHRIQVTDELGGSCDLVDLENKVVIDWKVVGDSSLKRYKKDGVGNQYRTQAHLYAYGLLREGRDIEDVAIVFLPRGGSLRGMYVWTEPFDLNIAAEGVAKLQAAKSVVAAGGIQSLKLLRSSASFCHYCPFYLPASTDLSVGCPGGDVPTQPNTERR